MILKVWVKESEEYLNKLIKVELNSVTRDKLRSLLLIKTDKVREIQELAELLGRHRNSVANWLEKYRKRGLPTMLELKPKGTSKKK